MSSAHLLKLAVPFVKTHGFTRDALSRSVLALPVPHAQPLSETAVSSLFGDGDEARIVLVNAWLEDAKEQMKHAASSSSPVLKEVLRTRLKHNEPVLQHLPEAFALLASHPASPLPFDPLPAIKHAVRIADEACYIVKDTSSEMSWYTKRASLAAVYTAAELHQLTSPTTAFDFLDHLLETSDSLKASFGEVNLYASYVVRSWSGIIKSSGVF